MRSHLWILWFGFALALAGACKKTQETPPSSTGSAGSATAAASSPGVAADTDTTDHIVVLGHHKKRKPTDPVRIKFEKFKVVKASFDPKQVEGGTATIEIDLASFRTDSDERDDHLKSPAYLDVGKFATATVDIDNVKKKANNSYTADANVTAHGVTTKYPVTFDVIETTDDSIKIRGQHTFSRLDLGIGADPAKDGEEQVGSDLTIQMVLTLKKT